MKSGRKSLAKTKSKQHKSSLRNEDYVEPNIEVVALFNDRELPE